ncbi:MAG: beta-ketoacyl-[acyl-carrier-protein] synthase family protein, partial [Betaproteobacteria bacterium]|nr:beta-ketoacyl-[acyl-carrier-protein] synthase family protein [Betaproteobacteria bacterium]
EAIATVLALREGHLPPTANLDGNLDPACTGVAHVLQGRAAPLRAALSNSFAFGGSNAVLIAKRFND